MTKRVTCAQCRKRLHEGDPAYEQQWRRITVRGKRVTFTNVTVIVCPDCAVPPDQTCRTI
jgi:hypothetical protein